MEKINFKDRKKELRYLDTQYDKNGSAVVVIYGRRRVGKTELIKRFIGNKKAIYYLADKRGARINSREFARYCADSFNDVPPEAEGFYECFQYIRNRIANEKLIVVIDEFSYLVDRDNSIPSVFQKIVDEVIKDKNILLILCGSNMSMMYESTLSYKSPLYGRVSSEWKLAPLDFEGLKEFFESAEEMVKYYSVFGNIPAYLSVIEKNKSFEKNIVENILTKGGKLYKEPDRLLREELSEPSSYEGILESMAKSTKLTQIAINAGFEPKDMPKYFKVLKNLDLIRKEVAVTERKTKKSEYHIDDNLILFWYTFVSRRFSLLEMGNEEFVFDKYIKNNLNIYIGKQFERLCIGFVNMRYKEKFDNIGRFWTYYRENNIRKQVEIDVLCLDEDKRQIAFFECKWKTLKERQAIGILEVLKEKSKYVGWNLDKRKEFFGLIGKKIENKNRLRKDGYMVFDLEDF